MIYLHSMKTFLEGHVVQSEDRLVDGALGMMAWMHRSADGNTGPWGSILKSRSIDSYLPINCCIAGTYSTYISDALIQHFDQKQLIGGKDLVDLHFYVVIHH